MARDGAVGRLQPDHPPRRAGGLCRGERFGTHKGALTELDRPAQPGVERVGGLVHVVAVESQAGLQPAGVAGAEPAGKDTRVSAGLEQRPPDLDGVLGGNEELKAVLARVAGAGDEGSDAVDLALPEPEIGQ